MTSRGAKLRFPPKPWAAFLNKQQREMLTFSWSQGEGAPATGPDVQRSMFAEHTKDSMWKNTATVHRGCMATE